MRIVVCEDESTYRNSMHEKIKKWQRERNIYDIQIELFHSSEDFLYAWDRDLSADLLLLDIIFPNEIDGLALAYHIRETDTNVPIVFITNAESFVHEGYKVSALRYLSKPLHYSDIAPCLDIAYRQYKLASKDFFIVGEQGRRVALHYSEIIYFEAQTPYTLLYKENGEPIKMRTRFSTILSQLPQDIFYPVHRSYIVNIMHLCALKRNEVLVSSGAVLPLSKTYCSVVNEAFDHYYHVLE